jgi:hypothetical protein
VRGVRPGSPVACWPRCRSSTMPNGSRSSVGGWSQACAGMINHLDTFDRPNILLMYTTTCGKANGGGARNQKSELVKKPRKRLERPRFRQENEGRNRFSHKLSVLIPQGDATCYHDNPGSKAPWARNERTVSVRTAGNSPKNSTSATGGAV